MTTMNLKGAWARSVPGLSADDFVDLTWRDGTAALSGIPSGSFGTKILTRGPGHGIFGGWHWDGTTLTAEVDRYGFFSMFYAAREGRILVSPSLWQLAARGADLTPDRRALAVFHRLGIFINDDTPFAGIRVLPPCGKLRWTRGKLTIDAPARRITPQQISPNDAVDGMIELFRRAIERTLRTWSGPIILPLSGGRDSRHILLELVRQGRPPEACVTFHHGGARWNTEVKAARALCEAVGVRHVVLGHPRSRQVDHLRAIALTQLCADEHAQMMPLHDYLLDHREAAAFDGIAGDILTNPDDDAEAYFQLAGAGNFAEIARRMITGHGAVISRAANGTGAGPLYSPGADDATVAYVADAIAAYADAPDPYQMFWLMHRTRREISFVANGILSPAQAVFTPYLDTDFVEFCTSLPYAVTRSQTLHDEAIHRAYPAYADDAFRGSLSTRPARRLVPAPQVREPRRHRAHRPVPRTGGADLDLHRADGTPKPAARPGERDVSHARPARRRPDPGRGQGPRRFRRTPGSDAPTGAGDRQFRAAVAGADATDRSHRLDGGHGPAGRLRIAPGGLASRHRKVRHGPGTSTWSGRAGRLPCFSEHAPRPGPDPSVRAPPIWRRHGYRRRFAMRRLSAIPAPPPPRVSPPPGSAAPAQRSSPAPPDRCRIRCP
ncbi:MAG: hypothetical protein R3D80_17270 [Paracoccaceae bacterium]